MANSGDTTEYTKVWFESRLACNLSTPNPKYMKPNPESHQTTVSGKDYLILLERKFPTKYEIHRRCIEQTKNLILTTDDKEFAERLVNGYNHC